MTSPIARKCCGPSLSKQGCLRLPFPLRDPLSHEEDLAKVINLQEVIDKQEQSQMEERLARSAAVPSITPFACHHNPLLETFLSILSQEGVMRRENEENPATPPRLGEVS